MCNRYSVYRIEQGRKITEIQHEKQDDKIIDGLITYEESNLTIFHTVHFLFYEN